MAPLNHMHKGQCSNFTILKMATGSSTIILPLPPNQPFDQITSTNTTELAASVNTVDRTVSSNTFDGTAKKFLKLVELITRITDILRQCHSRFGPPADLDAPVHIYASGYGSPFADLDPLYQTFLWSIVCIVFGNQFYLQAFCRCSFQSQHNIPQ